MDIIFIISDTPDGVSINRMERRTPGERGFDTDACVVANWVQKEVEALIWEKVPPAKKITVPRPGAKP